MQGNFFPANPGAVFERENSRPETYNLFFHQKKAAHIVNTLEHAHIQSPQGMCPMMLVILWLFPLVPPYSWHFNLFV